MAQNTVDFSTDMTGKVLLDTRLTPMQENILTSNSGTTTPVYAKKGTVWLNDGNGKLNVFDGTNNDPLLYEKTGVPMWDVNLATRYEQNAVVGYLKDGNYTFYRNLTGAGTTTPPDEDTVNWGKLDFGDFANKDLSNLTSTGLDAFARKDLSNIPAEYDYVVESHYGDEGWYRVYKSGWVEQGGITDNVQFGTVTFLKPLSESPKIVSIASVSNDSTNKQTYTNTTNITATSMDILSGGWTQQGILSAENGSGTVKKIWFVAGQGAIE